MSRLNNSRHELFALGVASGMPASRAYQRAGYVARNNAAEVCGSRLLRNVQVTARVEELLREVAKEISITKARLTWMLLEDRELAHQRGQAAAAAAITARVAGLYGFSFDPADNDEVSAPPGRPEPKQINFRELNEIFSSVPVHPQAADHVGDALHPQAAEHVGDEL
jgi:hypothetical protein